jgi:hypothetical protein
LVFLPVHLVPTGGLLEPRALEAAAQAPQESPAARQVYVE